MFDLLIINGICPDFKKGEMIRTDIGILEGKITFIGQADDELKSTAVRMIDAAGKVVSPGFIDIHMHEENFAKEGIQGCFERKRRKSDKLSDAHRIQYIPREAWCRTL